MEDDYYSDADSSAPSPKEASSKDSETQTALLPQSLCPGMEPGDVIKVRIERSTDQDYVVSYVEDDEEPEEMGEMEEETVTESDEMFS